MSPSRASEAAAWMSQLWQGCDARLAHFSWGGCVRDKPGRFGYTGVLIWSHSMVQSLFIFTTHPQILCQTLTGAVPAGKRQVPLIGVIVKTQFCK